MAKRCKNYVGVACVNGSCPMANREEYEEWGIPIVRECGQCYYYKGCEDCALAGTEHCSGELEGQGKDCRTLGKERGDDSRTI